MQLAQISQILAGTYGGVGLLVLALCVPLLRGRIKPNRWYGFRFPQALLSDENWYAINRFGARCFIGWAAVFIFAGVALLAFPFQNAAAIAPFMMLMSVTFVPPLTMTWRYALKFEK